MVSYSWVIKEKCEVTANECEVSFGSDKHISVLIGVMLVQLCDCTKNHWTIYFKWMNWMVFKMHFSKVVTKKCIWPKIWGLEEEGTLKRYLYYVNYHHISPPLQKLLKQKWSDLALRHKLIKYILYPFKNPFKKPKISRLRQR